MDNNKIAIGAGVLVLVAIVGYLVFSNRMSQDTVTAPAAIDTTTQASPTPSSMEMVVDLAEQNSSSQSGIATLKEVDGKVMVKVEVKGAPKDVSQPAHIHTGACPTPGVVKYPLTNVVNGMSETTLDTTLEKLKAELPLAVNIHKSVPQSSIYVACGNL